VGVRLASSVASRGDTHQSGVLPVLHVANEDSIFDQCGAVCRRAFIVNGQRAAPLGDCAVIDNGHTFGCNLLSHQTGESRGFLAVEIAFQPVADSFVQHHPWPAAAEHDVKCPRGCRHRFQIDQCLPQGFIRAVAPGILRDEFTKAAPTARSVGT